jgi:hypothetical protein
MDVKDVKYIIIYIDGEKKAITLKNVSEDIIRELKDFGCEILKNDDELIGFLFAVMLNFGVKKFNELEGKNDSN